jgi:hypothetical protein
MKHITDLNRERNEQIIVQAKEINQLRLANQITPVFIKGSGNLLEGLYDDIAERMVGDIDFIVGLNNYNKSYKILQEDNYETVAKEVYFIPGFKHKPRLKTQNKIAAVEVHKEFTLEKYADEFNYDSIKEELQKIDGVIVLSYQNQLVLSIIANQINNDGFLHKNIALRNGYDVFLLSKNTVAKEAFLQLNNLKNPLTCFLAVCHLVFGELSFLEYVRTKETNDY